MKLLHTPTLASDLRNRSIFIDSTALIDAAYSTDFLALLTDIANSGCILFTIPSVVYEYTRTSNTLKGYKERLEFIKELGIVVLNRIEETIEKDSRIFAVAYNQAFKDNKSPSYTDALLCTVAYKHRTSSPLILTANHKDIPLSIFDRKEFITIEIKGQFKVEAFYQFSEAKFGKVLSKLEKQASSSS